MRRAGQRIWIATSALIAIALLGQGCATAVTRRPVAQVSQRKGFLDRLNGLDSPRRRGPAASLSASRGGAAIAAGGGRETDASGVEPQPIPTESELRSLSSTARFHWPLAKVEITSVFGRRGSEFHEGVDLRAKSGTPVLAVQSGTIMYAGRKISGYGKMVVIRHADGLVTVYAHNSRLLVKRGDKVRQGQKIAISGQSGRVSGPHLHFEVRKGIVAVDPALFLPSSELAAASSPGVPEIRRTSARATRGAREIVRR